MGPAGTKAPLAEGAAEEPKRGTVDVAAAADDVAAAGICANEKEAVLGPDVLPPVAAELEAPAVPGGPKRVELDDGVAPKRDPA